jgi:hypothetical protein
MTERLPSLPFPVTEEFVQSIVDNVQKRRESSCEVWFQAALSMKPRDELEQMLATLFFGHAGLILDSIHDFHTCENSRMKPRITAAIIALDRAMMSFLKEFRLARARPVHELGFPRPMPVVHVPEPAASAQEERPSTFLDFMRDPTFVAEMEAVKAALAREFGVDDEDAPGEGDAGD